MGFGKIGLALALVLPSIVMACPDLAGNYECTSDVGDTLLEINDPGGNQDYRFSFGHFFSGVPDSPRGGSFILSKVGGSSDTLEGVGETQLAVSSICEGDVDLKVEADFNDPISGHTRMTRKILKDHDGNIRESTEFRFAGGSRTAPEIFCGRRAG